MHSPPMCNVASRDPAPTHAPRYASGTRTCHCFDQPLCSWRSASTMPRSPRQPSTGSCNRGHCSQCLCLPPQRGARCGPLRAHGGCAASLPPPPRGVPPQPLSAVTVPVTDCPGIVLRERRAVRLVARRRLGRLAARDPRRRRVRPPATHRPPRSTPSHLYTHRHTHPPARSAHHTPSTPRPAPSRPLDRLRLCSTACSTACSTHASALPLPLRAAQSVFAAARQLLARRCGARLPELP